MSDDDTIRVLYAEDDPRDADLLHERLQEVAPHIDLEVVKTGETCLQRIEKPSRYDVVVLDQHLPDLTGIEILEKLVHKNVHVPIVLVTGSGDEEIVVKALRGGAVDYLVKNERYLDDLPATLERIVQGWKAGRLQLPVGAERSRRILYVEHIATDVDLTLAHFAVDAPHFQFETVSTCEMALRRVQQGDRFDGLLVDLRMPDMSGIEFMRRLRMQGQMLPVVIVTGKGDEQTAIAALQLGAYDYIIKRDSYLTQLPFALEHAITHFCVDVANGRLQAELREINQSLEQKVLLRTAELAAKNAELEAFVYTISHDLKTPLITISGFSHLGLEDLQEQRFDQVRDSLQEIHHAVGEMQQLIEQLLDLSRLGYIAINRQPVALASLISQVMTSCAKLVADTRAVIRIAPSLPVIQVDPIRFRQVVQNLLENALKFTRPNSTPLIDFGYEQHGEEVRFFVRDNGRGIKPSYLERIFGLFERLDIDVDGTGVGLAITKRIIELHGGRIWVDSIYGEGSTFWLGFPAALVQSPSAN